MRPLFFLLASLFIVQVGATDYYVSANSGNDNNNGLSQATAFSTIQRAADLTLPGDVVFIMAGTYTNAFPWEDLLYISRSGAPGAPITYTANPGDSPVLSFNGWHGIKIEGGVSYIDIIGLEVVGNNANINLNDALNQPGGCNDPNGSPDGFYNGNGIASDGRFQGQNHHITVRECAVHDCAGAGISMIHTDYVTIENCVVYNNAWYAIYGTSGISIYQAWNYDNTTGIRNIIRNNRVFNNRMFVPWIAFCQITDGNGIIIDDGRNTQNGSTNGAYTGRTFIQNNLVYDNGGRGIHVFESDHVDVFHNTVYNNGASPEISDGEITAVFASDVNVRNNIMYARSGERLNSVMGTNINYDFNLNYNSTQYDQIGTNSLLGSDPLFNDLAARDFSLTAASPAIDAGGPLSSPFNTQDFSGTPRPTGPAPDMGALEYATALPVVYAAPPKATLVAASVRLDWSTRSEEDNDYFEVWHATQTGRFVAVGQRAAEVNEAGVNHYEFIHPNPSPGTNYYYIRQYDRDGRYSNSVVMTVQIAAEVQIFPNPVRDRLRVIHKMESGYYTLYNTQGAQVKAGVLDVNDLILSGLSAGVYYLDIRSRSGESVLRRKVLVRGK